MKPASTLKPDVLIRCDGSGELGFGHVGRCLAIAEELRELGQSVAFAMRPDTLANGLVREHGHPVVAVNGTHGAAAVLLDVRDGTTAADVERLRRDAVVAVLDDASERRLVADLAFYPPVARVARLDWVGFSGELNAGWEWIPLRREFREPAVRTHTGTPRVLVVLVTMGGSDPAGLTVRALEELVSLDPGVELHVLVGRAFCQRDALADLLGRCERPIVVHDGIDRVSDAMRQADLAVASFGVTAYELAALGVPAVHLCLTADHADSARALVDAGIALSLGEHDQVAPGALLDAVTALLAAPDARAAMSRRGRASVGSGGAERIARRLLQAVESRAHRGETIESVDGFDVIECESCGFRHVMPLPSVAELDEEYRKHYFTAAKPDYVAQQREDLEWWSLVHGDRYELFERLLAGGRRRLLDVGSGPGFFLSHGRARGWSTVGVEPSEHAAAHARSLGEDVVEEPFTAALLPSLGAFDVVHMSEVLEHVRDPAEVLSLAHACLEPDGLVCIVVPNDFSPIQAAAREQLDKPAWWVAPPHHLNYFDFDSLTLLLERCGFDVCERTATFPIDLFLLMGDDYIGDETAGRAAHARRTRLELALERGHLGELRRDLYRVFARHGVGREALVVGRRRG